MPMLKPQLSITCTGHMWGRILRFDMFSICSRWTVAISCRTTILHAAQLLGGCSGAMSLASIQVQLHGQLRKQSCKYLLYSCAMEMLPAL